MKKEKIKIFIENNGIVFGGSAGAIILGQCIDTCKYADKNEVDLKDLMGFDVVRHFSFLCNFTNKDEEKTTLIDEIDDNMSLDELMSLYEKKFKD